MSGVEQQEVEKPERSPCISVCVLNMDDVCTGCFRSADEISHWTSYNNGERRACNARALEREKTVNPFL